MHVLCWDESRGVARPHQRQAAKTDALALVGESIKRTCGRARTCAQRLFYLPECSLACGLNPRRDAYFETATRTLTVVGGSLRARPAELLQQRLGFLQAKGFGRNRARCPLHVEHECSASLWGINNKTHLE